jgi:predicted nuclease of predicted toxin-antitoxin system
MARLFADENFSFPVVERLRSLGHDILTVSQIGRANQRWPDEDVFLFCVAQERILLAKNRRDFYKLHLGFRSHPGIIACTEDSDFSGAATRIDEVLSNSEIAGQFIRIYRRS